jgi:hypothetical protein
MLSLVAVVIVAAIYVSFRVHQSRAGGGAGQPPAGAALSIFVTDQLAGFREPYT